MNSLTIMWDVLRSLNINSKHNNISFLTATLNHVSNVLITTFIIQYNRKIIPIKSIVSRKSRQVKGLKAYLFSCAFHLVFQSYIQTFLLPKHNSRLSYIIILCIFPL